MTRHIELDELVDVVRGLASATIRARVERHLDTQCARCTAARAWAEGVVVTARRAASVEVPPGVVSRAMAAFPAAAKPTRWTDRLVARLIFDSAVEPLPAGVRAGHHAGRHLLYRAGAFVFDLRLSGRRGERTVSLVGQVARELGPPGGVGISTVTLASHKATVAEASVNAFGEFQFEYEPTPRLRLRFPLEPGPGRIEVPLSGIDASARPRTRATGV